MGGNDIYLIKPDLWFIFSSGRNICTSSPVTPISLKSERASRDLAFKQIRRGKKHNPD